MQEFPFQHVIRVSPRLAHQCAIFACASLTHFLFSCGHLNLHFPHFPTPQRVLSTYLSLPLCLSLSLFLFHSLGAVISECRQRQPNDVTLSAGLFFLQVVPLIWPTPTPDCESVSESESELESQTSRNPRRSNDDDDDDDTANANQ